MKKSLAFDKVDLFPVLNCGDVLAIAPEPEFDDITELAAQICGTPYSAITLIDGEHIRFKSRSGVGMPKTLGDYSFCSYTVLGTELLIVPDTLADNRFINNSLVVADPCIRFYAGMPLVTRQGQVIGALCVLDIEPRELDQKLQNALQRLSRQVVLLLEARRDANRLNVSEERYRRLFEAAKDGVLILNATTGEVQDVNPFLCQLLGYENSEILTRLVWEIDAFDNIVKNKNTLTTIKEAGYIRYDDLPLQSKSGQEILVEVVGNVYDCAGKKFIQFNIRDITPEKLAVTEQERFFTLSLDMLWILDMNAVFKRLNPSVKRLLGFEPEELIGQSALDYLHPDDLASSVMALGQLKEGLPVNRIVNRFRCKDGSFKSIQWETAPCGDHIYAAGRDITERLQAEESLGESQRFLQATLDALKSHIAVLDETGKIIAVNKAWQMFSDANEGTAITCGVGTNYLDVCTKADGECADEAKTVVHGIHDVMDGYRTAFSLEYPCHSPLEQRWFNVSVTRFMNEGQVRVVVAHKDVTERKHAENQRDRFFTLSLDMLCISGFDGTFKRINPAFTDTLGFSETELLAMPFWDLVHHDDLKATQVAVEKLSQSNPLIGFENRLRTKDGSWRWLEWKAIAVPDEGLIYSAARDITERKRIEETVHASEERLRFVTDNARVGLVMIDDEHRYTFANATYAEILGLPSSDIVGLRIADVLPHLYEDQIRPRLARAFAGERVVYELQQSQPDGDHHFMVKYEPTKLHGSVAHVVVVITDVTERKQAEESVRQGESRVAGIVNAAMDAIITIDSTQRIILFNPAAERMFGYPSEVILGQTLECLIPERFRAAHGEHIRLFGQRGITSRKMGALGALSGLRADGEEFPIEASISQIDIAGQTLFTVILRDITERKQAEAALRQSHDELERRVAERTADLAQTNADLQLQKTILESQGNASIDGIMAVSTAGKIMSFNRRFVEMWGLSPEIVASGSDEFALQSVVNQLEDPQDFLNKVNYLYEHPNEESQEEILLSGGRVFDRYSAPVKGMDGVIYGRIWFFNDITERKQFEAALHQAREEADKANIAKSEFLSRMSHELRTPLNAILGFGQLLGKQDFEPAQQERVQHILRAGRHLLNLINEVLDIARIEAGHMVLSLEPVLVSHAVQEAFSLVRPLAVERGITLHGSDNPNLELYVLADQQRLKQVLLNLCSNAIKYNRSGGAVYVTCQITPAQENATSRQLRICVTDTGIGIAAEAQPHLFMPFMRLGAAHTTIEGTGLGLALSLNLTRVMGGTMGMQSTVGEGSTFWVQLPMVDGPTFQGQGVPEVNDDSTTPNAKRHTLLYIEDNLSNLRLIEDILADEPAYELITAMQGQIGLDFARQHHPDLVLLDLHLPDISGDQVLTRLKGEPTTADIPVVMLSAVATDSEIKRLLATGADAYLTKPLDVNQFLTTLTQILQPTLENK